MKKVLALVLALCLALSLAACGGSGSSSSTPAASGSGSEPAASTTPTAAGSVYYLNFKPEQDEAWQALAKAYTAETGVPVTVVTAASGEYETTLMAEMGKSEAPTLFQVNGPVGLANWKDYCYDLSGSDIYTQLTSDDYALKEGDTVYGIAYVIESYGIITNKTLLEKAGYTLEDIQSFEDLKKVAEDITSRKDELGFAAFTSAGMDGSSDWRFKTHLANLPVYFEYQEDGISTTDAIKGTNVFRTVFFMPNLIGGIVLGYIWQILINCVLSLVKQPLLQLNTAAGYWGLIILMCWQQVGYMMIIYIAGLQNVPGDLIEAAQIDGANPWQALVRIKLPMVMSSVTICLFLSLTNSFKLFDQNLSLTGGEPNHASEMLALNIYNTFYTRSGPQWKGIGQAKAVIFFVLVVAIALVQLRATRSREVQQ